jgi:hypothetical protein
MEEALLFITGSVSGSGNQDGYEVKSYRIDTNREISKDGQPHSALRAITIELTIYSIDNKSEVIGILFEMYQVVSGRIEFYANDNSGAKKKFKTVKFDKAHIVKYSEQFSFGEQSHMMETFTISAGKLDVDGRSFSSTWSDE